MALSVELHKKFKGFQMDVAFEHDGGSLGILGGSGMGKSMTLKMIAGCRKHLPEFPITVLEGTYLVWMDCHRLGIHSQELEQRLVNEAGFRESYCGRKDCL